MSSSTVITSEQIEKSLAWVQAYYEACDAYDVQNWITKFYYPDAVLHFGNLPPIRGHEAIMTYFERMSSQLASMKHTVKHVDVLRERVYVQIEGTGIVKNDPEQKPVNTRAVIVFEKKVDENKVTRCDAFIDPTPLLDRIKSCTCT